MNNFPLQDIIVVCLMVFGFLIGLTQGFFKKLHRVIIVLIVFCVIYFCLGPMLANWIQYDCLKAFGITLNATILEETYTVESINDIFLVLENLDLNKDLLVSTASGLCNILAFIVLFIVSIPVSIIISVLLWHLLFKHLFSKKMRKGGVISHFFGGILGAAEWLAISTILIVASGSLLGGVKEVLIPSLLDENTIIYNLFVNFGLDTSLFKTIADYLQVALDILSPASTQAYIVPWVMNLFGEPSALMNLFTGIKFNESGEQVNCSFYDAIAYFWNEVYQVKII